MTMDARAHDPERTSYFLARRPRLLGIAYRMLGSTEDAEDVVQEGFLKWHQADPAAIRSGEAWLVSVVTRLAIDRLRRARVEREHYTGPWLPEPIQTPAPAADRDTELASELSIAFLVLLERLAPEERAAFLLHEVFDAGYPEIAETLDKSEAACRQLVHRARTRVREDRARFDVPAAARAGLLERFLAALAADDQEGVLALLDPAVTWVSDGGGKVPSAQRAVVGADRVAKLVLGWERKGRGIVRHALTWVNGEPAFLSYLGERLFATTSVAVADGRIVALYRVMNPDKLRRVR
jgi:RNA polymerase sigma-70 factor (ECF subfamily)